MTKRGWESTEEWRMRQVGAGLRSMRLPEHYEVVDAELAGMLMALKEVSAQHEPGQRKCLLMSDCKAALMMVEKAWRAERRTYAMGGRGAMLEAICTEREKLEIVVTMYIPAHRGGWVSAMADAAAKAGQGAAHGDISTQIVEGVKWRPIVNMETEAEGRWSSR